MRAPLESESLMRPPFERSHCLVGEQSELNKGARRPLPAGVVMIGESRDYVVAVWRNVMILLVRGAVDAEFLELADRGYLVALEDDHENYAVAVIAESTARLPPMSLRTEASRLRVQTEAKLRAQAVILGGDGFFAGAMRGVMTSIMAAARSRVPMKMVGANREAAEFLAEKLQRQDGWTRALTRAIDELRETGPAGV